MADGVKYICKGPRVPGKDPMEDARIPCGNDLSKLVEAVPRDGQNHKVTCPKCGTVTTVQRFA